MALSVLSCLAADFTYVGLFNYGAPEAGKLLGNLGLRASCY